MAEPYYSDPLVTLHLGDCLDVMLTLEAESVDAVVTDPPYGLGFMGKHWDHGVPGVDFWREMYRVLKPGGYLLSFAGTRTVHRFGVAIEDAGFEIRDTLMWIYASGFPKSLDVSRALDKAAGAEREVVGHNPNVNVYSGRGPFGESMVGEEYGKSPITELARKWEGWGTALKPAHEPIVMARKPLVGTVAANVTRYGTGAINVDACRIATDDDLNGGTYSKSPNDGGSDRTFEGGPLRNGIGEYVQPAGRWPSNVLLSDPELFDEPNPYVVGSGATVIVNRPGPGSTGKAGYEGGWSGDHRAYDYGDSGGYSRFFLIPSRYNGTCVRCGLAISAESRSYRLSPSADTAPSGVATSPDGTPDSTANGLPAPSPNGSESTTRVTGTPSSSAADVTMPRVPISRPHGTSRASTLPSSPAKSPDAASPEIVTTTTTPDRWMCATCAAAITSPTTSDSDGLPEPYPRALIIPKADRAERERGLAGAPKQPTAAMQGNLVDGQRLGGDGTPIRTPLRANVHPTVKPIDLMRHLVRLVTPPGGVVLDPFLGSGTTALAASEEGFRCIGIEREAEYLEIAKGRLMATPMGLGLEQ